MKGEAEAFAVEAKAKAEAEQMTRKAEAWKQYEDAAVVDMVLDVLPKVLAVLLKKNSWISSCLKYFDTVGWAAKSVKRLCEL